MALSAVMGVNGMLKKVCGGQRGGGEHEKNCILIAPTCVSVVRVAFRRDVHCTVTPVVVHCSESKTPIRRLPKARYCSDMKSDRFLMYHMTLRIPGGKVLWTLWGPVAMFNWSVLGIQFPGLIRFCMDT